MTTKYELRIVSFEKHFHSHPNDVLKNLWQEAIWLKRYQWTGHIDWNGHIDKEIPIHDPKTDKPVVDIIRDQVRSSKVEILPDDTGKFARVKWIEAKLVTLVWHEDLELWEEVEQDTIACSEWTEDKEKAQ